MALFNFGGTKKSSKGRGKRKSKRAIISNDPIKRVRNKSTRKTVNKQRNKTKGKAGEPPLSNFDIVKFYKKVERGPTTRSRDGVIVVANPSTNHYDVLLNNGVQKTNVHRDYLVLIKNQTPLEILINKTNDANVVTKFKKAGLYKKDSTNKVGRARFFALSNKEDDMTVSIQRIVYPGRFHGPN